MALTKTGTDGIKDDAVTLDKLAHGTSSQDGKFLRANNGAAPSFESISNQTLTYPNGSTAVTTSTNNEIQVNSSNSKVVFDTDTSNTHHISFAGPSTLTKVSEFTLPEDGSNGQYLKTNGSGVLSFGTVDLTALSASNLTSGTIPDARFPATLPAISGANLTNLPASGTVTNLVLNGAMSLAQRGTSATGSGANGMATVDRWKATQNGTDDYIEQHQVDVASGTTPYTLGFRKAFQIKNGNQTGGAGSGDYVRMSTVLEGQDIAQSGWNYKSTSSYITLSFWVKSSVAQNFYGFIRSTDGTMQQYPFETGSLSADTWTKVTKTISGNSNLAFDNNTDGAFELWIHQFAGTDETASGVTLNAWAAYNGNAKMPDNTSTWYTTNDATFELTGVLLEVGNTASDFPHESPNETLRKCKRYCHVVAAQSYTPLGIGFQYYSGNIFITYGPIDMRTTPTMVAKSGSSGGYVYEKIFSNSAQYHHQISLDSKTKKDHAMFIMSGDNTRAGEAVRTAVHSVTLNNNEPFVYLDAEI